MKTPKILSVCLPALCLMALLGACKQNDPLQEGSDPLESIQPVYTEIRDVDQDGQPDLIIGFDRKEVMDLEKQEVILEGRFSTTATLFETDVFQIQQ